MEIRFLRSAEEQYKCVCVCVCVRDGGDRSDGGGSGLNEHVVSDMELCLVYFHSFGMERVRLTCDVQDNGYVVIPPTQRREKRFDINF